MAITTSNCPLCCSNNIRKLGTAEAIFQIWHCGECTFTWVDRNDLAKPEAAASYEDYGYNQNLRKVFEQMKPLYIKGLQKRIIRTLGDRALQNCAFLDIGCANGEYLWTAKSLGFGVVAGVEIDSVSAKQASSYGEVTDDVGKFPPVSFDVVQLKNVLGNINDFVSLMNSSLKVLKPNGVLLIDVLNQDSGTAMLRSILMRDYQEREGGSSKYGYLRPPYVINGFNKASLKELFRRWDLTPTWLSSAYPIENCYLPYTEDSSFVKKALFTGFSMAGKGAYLLAEAKLMHPGKASKLSSPNQRLTNPGLRLRVTVK
jgi:SAM-dependent methyltransferase